MEKLISFRSYLQFIFQVALFISGSLCSLDVIAETQKEETEKAESSWNLGEKLENLGQIYEDESNEIIQELWLLGRFHGQYYWLNSDEKNTNDYETRRARAGFQGKFFRNLTVHAQMVSGSNIDPVYNGFTELWMQWSFRPEFALTIGQQKHRFTHDRNVSSRYLNYLERSMLTNMFALDYTPAITAQGVVDKATYYTGFFSNATGRNMGDSFTKLDSGYSYIGAVYYDLEELFGADNITLHATFLHSDAKSNATNLDRFDTGVSTALIVTKDNASLVTEVTTGLKSSRGDALGLNLQPSYFLNEFVQLVGRYQLAVSDVGDGLSPQSRYEMVRFDRNQEDLSRGMSGDLYQAGYLGIDYYIARHRFKIMHGIEYANMNGRGTWTTSVMFRFFFGPHSGGAFPMNQVLPLEYD